MFQQDNAPSRKCRDASLRKFRLQEHLSEFGESLPAPKFPELNLIEHNRDAMRLGIEQKILRPRNPFELWDDF